LEMYLTVEMYEEIFKLKRRMEKVTGVEIPRTEWLRSIVKEGLKQLRKKVERLEKAKSSS